jgi:hypothetical protein
LNGTEDATHHTATDAALHPRFHRAAGSRARRRLGDGELAFYGEPLLAAVVTQAIPHALLEPPFA